jgi:hypothetical protein
VTDPLVLRVLRPYSNADEYLAAEAWTIQSKTMLLIGESPQPAGIAVRFDVVLGNGEKVIRAEGSVVRYLEAIGQRPGGLEVRFKRFGGATKGFIDRVLAARSGKRRTDRVSMRPELASLPELPATEAQPAPVAAEPPPAAAESPAPVAQPLLTALDAHRALRQRRTGPVAAPPNREHLLERLRERARGLKKAGPALDDASRHRQYGG